jgi:hypothetical protein
MGHVLQHIVMPNLAFGAPEEMYVRLHNDKVHALMSERRLFFDSGGRASFDTFFNSFTVGAWKIHTVVQDLQLHLRGSGRFVVRLGIRRNGHAQRWLAERVVTFTPDVDVQMNHGLVAYLCRSDYSFRLPGVRRPGGFCPPKLNAFGAGYRSR